MGKTNINSEPFLYEKIKALFINYPLNKWTVRQLKNKLNYPCKWQIRTTLGKLYDLKLVNKEDVIIKDKQNSVYFFPIVDNLYSNKWEQMHLKHLIFKAKLKYNINLTDKELKLVYDNYDKDKNKITPYRYIENKIKLHKANALK